MPTVGSSTIHAPEFEPSPEWLNSPPLTLAGLRGRPVLIDFWDFTCVNCLRTLPYLREWHRRYSPLGLTVIGIHTPEFRFAREARQVAAAVKRLGIEWPVLLDPEYRHWEAYANRYWPTKYLLDGRGIIQWHRSGEGGYAETERRIQQLIREIDPSADLPRPLEPLRAEDAPGAVCHPTTPELYAGLDRGALGNPEGYATAPMVYRLPPPPAREEGHFYAEGTWQAELEGFTFVGRSGRIVVPYRAASIYAVMAPSADPVDLMLDLKAPVTVTVRLDGRPVPVEEMGVDLRREAGATFLDVSSPRLYAIAAHPAVTPRELELEVHDPGFSLFSFTFSSCIVAGSG